MSEITLYRPVFEKHASAKKLDKSKANHSECVTCSERFRLVYACV